MAKTYVGPGGVPKYPGYQAQSARNRTVGTIKAGKSFNRFPEIIAAFPGALSAIVKETTEAVAAGARSRAIVGAARADAPKPGTLRKSIKTRYSKRRSDGNVQTGRIDVKAVDPTKDDPKHWYGWYVEWGTVHTAAHPFLVPSIIEQRPVFLGKLERLESRL